MCRHPTHPTAPRMWNKQFAGTARQLKITGVCGMRGRVCAGSWPRCVFLARLKGTHPAGGLSPLPRSPQDSLASRPGPAPKGGACPPHALSGARGARGPWVPPKPPAPRVHPAALRLGSEGAGVETSRGHSRSQGSPAGLQRGLGLCSASATVCSWAALEVLLPGAGRVGPGRLEGPSLGQGRRATGGWIYEPSLVCLCRTPVS